MKINRNNYEIFFIDFYDGRLTGVQQLEMELFLDGNPDLKAEFEAFDAITIDTADISFSSKQALKKPEIVAVAGMDEDNYEEAFIAWHENDLDVNEKATLLSFLEANPHLENEFGWHASLVLKKEDLVFEDKDSLKKRAYIGYFWYSSAAAVLIFLTLSFFLNQNKPAQPVNRFELLQIEKVTISNAITTHPSSQLKVQQKSEQIVKLPIPEVFKKESIHTLTSVGLPDDQALKQQVPVYLIDRVYTNENFLMAEAEQPKKRGLLAQFFRKNVAEISENLGIDNALAERSDKKKKDPGFVKFLDGSLTVFNTITGSDNELVKNYDNEGNLRNYSLEGQAFVVNRKLPAGKSFD